MGHLQFGPGQERLEIPTCKDFESDGPPLPACGRLVRRHALRRGRLPSLKSLFRGNAASPGQFTITLATRGTLGTRNFLVQFITTTMARFAQPLTITRNGAIAVFALIFCTWLAV